MRTGPNIRKRIDGRYDARYIKGRTAEGKIVYGYCYGKTFEEAMQKREAVKAEQEAMPARAVKRMNLLILGAGGQGLVVREVAESLGVFSKIGFLDDDPENPYAIGTIAECPNFVQEYPIALPSVGDYALRWKWIDLLVDSGFVIPTLIHPTATISPSAKIDYGTLIEPKVTIGANAKIGIGCIISSGAVIDRDVIIADGTHIDCGETIRKV